MHLKTIFFFSYNYICSKVCSSAILLQLFFYKKKTSIKSGLCFLFAIPLWIKFICFLPFLLTGSKLISFHLLFLLIKVFQDSLISANKSFVSFHFLLLVALFLFSRIFFELFLFRLSILSFMLVLCFLNTYNR